MNLQTYSSADTPNRPGVFEPVIKAIKTHGETLRNISGVLGVRPGLRIKGGELTDEPVIIVITQTGEPTKEIPAEIDGLPIQVRKASPLEIVEGLLPLSIWEGLLPEAVPFIHYIPPDPSEVALAESWVSHIICHVGPDSGWITLKPFIEGTTTSLTVAMYEFYANHIIDAVKNLGKDTQVKLKIILQVSSNDEAIEETLNESWGNRLEFARASVSGPNRIFNNSYHTKVAVRDSSAFWLSSGNWSPSSQPLIEPGVEQVLYSKGNREWHVIIEDERLAQMYEKFIKYDMRQARAVGVPEAAPEMPDLLIPEAWLEPEAAIVQDHPFVAKTFATSGDPVRVKPLMSPDNYAKEILELIQNAESRLYLQFSYIRQPSTEKFDEIITAIANKMNNGLDVRVLVGSNQVSEHSELLVSQRGWKRNMFRRQTSKVHNKGILIDGKIAVVGSNNWSSDGTQYNRDSSLIFFSESIARYFTEVFLFDWNNLSKPIGSASEVSPEIAPESGLTPLGMIRIPWQAWFDE